MLQLRISLEMVIKKGISKDSTIRRLVKEISPNSDEAQIKKRSKMIIKRIKSQKFQAYWYSLPHLPVSNQQETEAEESTQQKYTPKDEFKKITSFQMNKNELFDDNMQLQTEGRLYSQNIYRSIPESIGCHFAIINVEFPGNNMIVFGKCKVANCQARLKLSAVLVQSSSQIKFDVFRKGDFFSENHKNLPRRYISGKFRESLACKVVQQGALKTQEQLLLSRDFSSQNYSNPEICQNLANLRKMASEKSSFALFSTNDVNDLVILKQITDKIEPSASDLTPSYIRYIRADELGVLLYCNSQLDAFLETNSRMLFVDATGNISSSKGKSRQFYYSGAFKSKKNNFTIPAFEFISSKHDIASLGSQMKFFARDLSLRANNSTPVKIVVTDFSFAIMNSVSLAFNDCSLLIYLDMIFKLIAKGENAYNNLTILATCSTHSIKFIADKISAHFGKDKKRTVMLNFAKAIECTKYKMFIDHLSEMYIVFKTENVRYNFLKNFIQIVGLSTEITECIDVLTEESDPLIEADFLPKASKYMKLSIIEEIETAVKDKLSKDQSNIVPNPFYSNELALYTLRKLCPFTLLWSSFCHQRLSNATIEGHNKVLKCNLDINNKKPGVAVRDLRTHTLAQILKENSGNIQPNAKVAKRTTCIEDPVENFKTRPKPQISIFDQVKNIVRKPFFLTWTSIKLTLSSKIIIFNTNMLFSKSHY